MRRNAYGNCHFVTCVSRKVYKSLMSEEYRESKWTCPLYSLQVKWLIMEMADEGAAGEDRRQCVRRRRGRE